MLPRLIPVLLLQRNGLYKTKKFKNPKYVGDPINAVRIFNDKEVDELIFLDIEASRRGSDVNLGSIRDIACECFMPLCFGGGVTSLSHIEKILKLGVEKIAINSALFYDSDFVAAAVKEFGSSTIVASIDYRVKSFGRKIVYVRGGSVSTKRSLEEHVNRAESLGVGEILLNAIDRDGTRCGFDIETSRLISNATSVPLVICGGAGTLDDMKLAVTDGEASAAAAGSLFVFVGKHQAVLINYPSQKEIGDLFLKSLDK